MLELAFQLPTGSHGNSTKDNPKIQTGQLKIRSVSIDAVDQTTQSCTFTGCLDPYHHKKLGGKIASPPHFGTIPSKTPKSSALIAIYIEYCSKV
jgi:hypothetical protein